MPTAIPTPSTPGRPVVRVGAGLDFATPQALESHIAARPLKTNNEIATAELYENFTLPDLISLSPPAGESDGSHYWIIRPVPGLDIASTDQAIELTLNFPINTRAGVRVEGFKINLQNAARLSMGGPNPGATPYPLDTVCGFARIKITSSTTQEFAVDMGEYNVPTFFTDIEFVRTAGTGYIRANGPATVSRNTFVGLNGTTGKIIDSSGSTVVENNAFKDIGPVPYVGNAAQLNGNITNIALTTPRAGITVDTVKAFFQSATDFRPAAGGALVGNATASANSINDIRGGNRGLDPDVGAWQLVPATPLPTGTVTGTPKPQGQQWTIPFTTTNNPTSGIFSLVPAAQNPGNAIGMTGTVTLAPGTGQAVASDIAPGNYQGTITISNDGGPASVSGIPALSILEISGSPTAGVTEGGEVPEPTGPLVIVSWAVFDTQAPPVVVDPPVATVTEVIVTPEDVTVIGGEAYQFAAEALGANNPPQTFTWVTTLGTVADGLVDTPVVGQVMQATVTATSTFDPTQSGSVSFTIAPDPALPPNIFVSTILSAADLNLTTALI